MEKELFNFDLDDDIDKYERMIAISFIERFFDGMLDVKGYNPSQFVSFEVFLENLYIYFGLNMANESLKFSLEEALNFLVTLNILESVDVKFNDETGSGNYKGYRIIPKETTD